MNIYLIILLNNLVKMTDLASFVYRFIFAFSLLIKQLIVICSFCTLMAADSLSTVLHSFFKFIW